MLMSTVYLFIAIVPAVILASGQTELCPAGSHMVLKPSIPLKDSDCLPCPDGQFTRQPNNYRQCRDCKAVCPKGTTLVSVCNATQDLICRCPHREFDQTIPGGDSSCLNCTQCGEDQVLVKECTANNDSICQCIPGKYMKDGKCLNLTLCGDDMDVVHEGTSWKDTVCEIRNRTGTTTNYQTSFTMIGRTTKSSSTDLNITTPFPPSDNMSEGTWIGIGCGIGFSLLLVVIVVIVFIVSKKKSRENVRQNNSRNETELESMTQNAQDD